MGGSWDNTTNILAGQLATDRIINVSASVAQLLLGLAGLSALSSELVGATKLIRGLVLITLLSTAAFTTATILRSQYGDVPFQISFVVTNFFSKVATCAVLMALAPTKKHRLPTLVVELTALFWVLYSVNWIARNTSPVSGPAFNLVSFWHGYAKYDILTDVGIILSPINCMRSTTLPLQKQVIVSLAFLPRILSSLSALARWRLLKTAAQDDRDISVAGIIWDSCQGTAREEEQAQGIDKAAKGSRSNGVEVRAANNLVSRASRERSDES
ncbi:hypothetical protein DV735_g347, partial [Chaetothyriales sp. CBS 134920]